MRNLTTREQLKLALFDLALFTTLSIPLFILGDWLRSSVGG